MLTRRQFLQHSAFAALLSVAHSPMTAASFAALAHGTTFGVPPESELLGRLFKATDVRAAPRASAKVVKQLPANHVQPILAVSDDGWWYRIAEGYLPREAMQPIPPYVRPPKPTALHAGYYEVIAPSTTLRAACAPYAAIYRSSFRHGRLCARLADGRLRTGLVCVHFDRQRQWHAQLDERAELATLAAATLAAPSADCVAGLRATDAQLVRRRAVSWQDGDSCAFAAARSSRAAAWRAKRIYRRSAAAASMVHAAASAARRACAALRLQRAQSLRHAQPTQRYRAARVGCQTALSAAVRRSRL